MLVRHNELNDFAHERFRSVITNSFLIRMITHLVTLCSQVDSDFDMTDHIELYNCSFQLAVMVNELPFVFMVGSMTK